MHSIQTGTDTACGAQGAPSNSQRLHGACCNRIVPVYPNDPQTLSPQTVEAAGRGMAAARASVALCDDGRVWGSEIVSVTEAKYTSGLIMNRIPEGNRVWMLVAFSKLENKLSLQQSWIGTWCGRVSAVAMAVHAGLLTPGPKVRAAR